MGKLRLKKAFFRLCSLLVPGCGKEGACVSPEEDSKETENSLKRLTDNSECLDVGIWGGLDDHLLEKIIARLPVESLFRAPSLSKTWKERFGSESFQHEVRSSMAVGNSYAPVLVNRKGAVLGYDRSSKRWYRLLTHSYIPYHVCLSSWMLVAGCGSLLCWTREGVEAGGFDYTVLVTRPSTKRWRELPDIPYRSSSRYRYPSFVHLLSEEGSNAYKVVRGDFHGKRGYMVPSKTVAYSQFRVHIFDSRYSSWTGDSYEWMTPDTFEFSRTGARSPYMAVNCGGSAIINEVLHMVIYTSWDVPSFYALISYHLKDKTWKEIPHLQEVCNQDEQKPPRLSKFYDIRFSRILVCGSDVLLVVVHREPGNNMDYRLNNTSYMRDTHGTLSVHKLDLERGLAFLVSRAPSEMISPFENLVRPFEDAVCHGDWIYIGGRHPPCSLPSIRYNRKSILYNIRSLEWHWFDSAAEIFRSLSTTDPEKTKKKKSTETLVDEWAWTSITYQPGLNLFARV